MLNITNKMKYRLALDLGTNSIGWSLIRLNELNEPYAIIKLGVRIFSDSRDPKSKESLAVTRRNARQRRKQIDRKLRREQKVLNTLVKYGFYPEDPTAQRDLAFVDPYPLRGKAITDELTPFEFGRAIWHLSQRRGFKSNRKADSKESETGKVKEAIKILNDTLESEGFNTVGEWLAFRHKNNQKVKNWAEMGGKNGDRLEGYSFYLSRTMVEQEFDKTWEAQKKFNPTLFTEEAYIKIKGAIFFQRPLKPVLPSRCSFYPDERRALLALPSVQEFRIYQEVNNLRIISDSLSDTPLTVSQRNTIATLLNSAKEVSFRAIKSALKLPPDTKFNLESDSRSKLKGNITAYSIIQIVGDKLWDSLSTDRQDNLVFNLIELEDDLSIIKYVKDTLGISDEIANKLCDLKFIPGYGSLSIKAINLILPHLKQEVITYDKAVAKTAIGSHSSLSVATSGEILEELPYYGHPTALKRHVAFEKDNPKNDEELYGKIANPTVHVVLNQLRKVVNAIIKKYGHPSEVIIEVARDLKLSEKQKRELVKSQAANQKQNEADWLKLCEISGKNPDYYSQESKRDLLQKYRLWKELAPDPEPKRCIYSGKVITLSDLFGEGIEIEHIFPYSRTLDDSMVNKTITFANINKFKDNKTPFEAFGDNSHPNCKYSEILERAKNLPVAKAKRFSKDGFLQWESTSGGFVARQLTDTAYVSKLALEYLSLICPYKVVASSGRITAMIRGKLGLNRLLSEDGSKNRNDHRHHALDAAVIGILDRSLVQKFSASAAQAEKAGLNRLISTFEKPWATFDQHLKRALDAVIVSHKRDHGYQGAFMEDTARKPIPVKNAEGVIVGFKDENENRLIPILPSEEALNIRHSSRIDKSDPYKGYIGGSNYCLEISNVEGKWEGRVVSRFEVYSLVKEKGESEWQSRLKGLRSFISNRPLIMRLVINDYVRLKETAGEDFKYVLMRVASITLRAGKPLAVLTSPTLVDNLKTERSVKQLFEKEAKVVGISEIGVIKG